MKIDKLKLKQSKKTTVEFVPDAYDVIIDGAYITDDSRGINFRLKLLDEDKIAYVRMYVLGKDGELTSFGENKLNELMVLTGLESIEFKEAGTRITELEQIKIGFLLDVQEYNGYENFNIITFYDIETEQTSYELEHQLEANYIQKILAKMDEEDN